MIVSIFSIMRWWALRLGPGAAVAVDPSMMKAEMINPVREYGPILGPILLSCLSHACLTSLPALHFLYNVRDKNSEKV